MQLEGKMKKQEFIIFVVTYFQIFFANGQFNNYGSQIGAQYGRKKRFALPPTQSFHSYPRF